MCQMPDALGYHNGCSNPSGLPEAAGMYPTRSFHGTLAHALSSVSECESIACCIYAFSGVCYLHSSNLELLQNLVLIIYRDAFLLRAGAAAAALPCVASQVAHNPGQQKL